MSDKPINEELIERVKTQAIVDIERMETAVHGVEKSLGDAIATYTLTPIEIWNVIGLLVMRTGRFHAEAKEESRQSDDELFQAIHGRTGWNDEDVKAMARELLGFRNEIPELVAEVAELKKKLEDANRTIEAAHMALAPCPGCGKLGSNHIGGCPA